MMKKNEINSSPEYNQALSNHYDSINWDDYNYPKFLRLVHFNMEEINEDELKKIVLRIRVVFILITTACFVNSIKFNLSLDVDSIIISSSHIYPFISIIYTFLSKILIDLNRLGHIYFPFILHILYRLSSNSYVKK
jgi:hypothetical protein